MKMTIEAVIIQDDGSTYRKELLEIEPSLNQTSLPGLSIDKSKTLLKLTQQVLVDAQSHAYMQRHRCCPECGKQRRIKGYQH
jgi:ribosomal protein L32